MYPHLCRWLCERSLLDFCQPNMAIHLLLLHALAVPGFSEENHSAGSSGSQANFSSHLMFGMAPTL